MEKESWVVLGQRITCDCHVGTIKYIGEVPPTQGIWWGVDWDDFSKGKHDGSYKGVRYFETASENSGSFVRPSRCSLGICLMDGIRQKYVVTEEDGEEINSSEDSLVIGRVEGKDILFVGVSDIIKEQSRLDTLKHVNLRRHEISRAGASNSEQNKVERNAREISVELKCHDLCLPSVIELDLSENLFCNWVEIEKIVKCAPILEVVNLQGNRFIKGIPDYSITLGRIKKHKQQNNTQQIYFCHQNIREVCMNDLNFQWETLVCSTLSIAPHVENLVASFNKVDVVDLKMWKHLSNHLQWQPLSMVKILNLQGNQLKSWQEVLKLSVIMPSLQTLVLNSCNINEVFFPTTEEEMKRMIPEDVSFFFADSFKSSSTENVKKTEFFRHLKNLSLCHNNISSWDSINELEKLPALISLNLTSNPLDKGVTNWEKWGHRVVARIGGLTHFNRVVIDRFDKRGAEIDYLNYCAKELNGIEASKEFLNKHLRYLELVKKYGAPDPYIALSGQKIAEVKAGLMSVNIALVLPFALDETSENKGREQVVSVLNRRLPRSMTVGSLKMMVKRLFKKDVENFITACQSSGGGKTISTEDGNMFISYSSFVSANNKVNLTKEGNPGECGPTNTGEAESNSFVIHPGTVLEIPIEDPFKEVCYYSVSAGDTLYVRYM